MKLSTILLLLSLLASAWGNGGGPVEPPPEPDPGPQQILLRPGLNAIPLTRFPSLNGGAGDRLSLAQVFGPMNEAGLHEGNADVADLIWIREDQRWRRFYYFEGGGFLGLGPGWRSLATGNEDMSAFSWPYHAGVLVSRRDRSDLVLTVNDVPRTTAANYAVKSGENFFNRVFDEKLTLPDLGLEAFFQRLPVGIITQREPNNRPVDANGNPAPGGALDDKGAFVELKTDWFFHPVTEARYILSQDGTWYDLETRRPVDASMVFVPGTFGIHAIRPFKFAVEAPAQVVSPNPPRQVVIRPGRNAVPITRFPVIDAQASDKLTLGQAFGTENEAGLYGNGEEDSDRIWISVNGRWRQFYYYGGDAFGAVPRGWKSLSTGVDDMSEFSWPYTAGVLIERVLDEPLAITFRGLARNRPAHYVVNPGDNFFNRVFDGELTLADLGLDAFFQRLPVAKIVERQPPNNGPAPGPGGEIPNDGAFVDLEIDWFFHPVTGARYILAEDGDWYSMVTREPIDAATILVPGTFGIYSMTAYEFMVESPFAAPAPTPAPVAQINRPAFLAAEEDGIRRLLGSDIGPPECTCTFLLHDNRPISLHVVETTPGHAVVRVGKHPMNVITDSIVAISGQGLIAPLDNVGPGFATTFPVRSFRSDQEILNALSYEAKLADPVLREQEVRYFSTLGPEASIELDLGTQSWAADTLLEIDLIAATENNRKIALHFPEIRLLQDTDSSGFANLLAALLRGALLERELVPANNLEIAAQVRDDATTLSLNFGNPLRMGKLDLCVLRPVEPPVISATSSSAQDGGLVTIIGGSFGKLIDDLCVVLAPADGTTGTIPLRPISISPDGTTLIARVVGRIPSGQLRRVMIARGVGRTGPLDLGFPDVIQSQNTWAWRGRGIAAASAPNVVRPALGLNHETFFDGTLIDGSLVLKLDQPWPDNATISISFTANTETVQLDAYAPELCFTLSGSTEDCAKRIQRVLKAAFVQGGMASANEIQVQRSIDGDVVTLTVNIFTNDGVLSPITNGHLNVKATEGASPKVLPNPDDTDGDLVQDSWETDNFGLPPENVQAMADPDQDDLNNNVEFAFSTEPQSLDNTVPIAITLDDEDHPLITYFRHIAAPNFYNYSIETSSDGDAWDALANIETLTTIQMVGSFTETVVSRCLVDVHQLDKSFYRVRLTPRS